MKGPLDTSLAYKYFMSYRLLDGQRYDETVVPYRPTRCYRKILKRFINSQTHLRVALSALAFVIATFFCIPGFSAYAGILLALALLLAIAVPLLPIVHGWYTATHLGVSPKGIRFYSLHWYGDKVSQPLAWSKVASVALRRQKSVIGQEEWIEVLSTEDGEAPLLRLSLDGIALGDHRKRLLAAFKQNLSPSQIDIGIQDILNPVRVGSATSLWLEVLSNSQKRLVETQLEWGQLVGNGKYRILEQLGIGGQAVAYVAEELDPASSIALNTVVLKEFVLPAEASLRISRRAFEAIEKESALLSQISHERIVALLDLFVDDHRAYMVLERVPGKNLRQVVRESGAFGEKQLIELALEMCEVLNHLHSLEPPVIHRDFSPDNLILSPESGIKLIDFNVAQQYEASATRTVVGKHSYIPPEQFRGKACPQSDLYALGATLFFLLTGEDPEPITVARPIRMQATVSTQLDKIVAKCTAQELGSRYRSASEIADDLKELRASRHSL